MAGQICPVGWSKIKKIVSYFFSIRAFVNTSVAPPCKASTDGGLTEYWEVSDQCKDLGVPAVYREIQPTNNSLNNCILSFN